MSRLAEEGYGLILTVDCGITAAEEVAEAKRLGLRVIVTDHHRPGDELPDCPIVATRPSEYPFPELCGTGVAYKLAQALGAPGLDDQLDLVALATIADVVPLVDENRALAIAGLAQLKLARRPGIAALMRTARVDPATVDEGAVAFRLAPRINAAGRLCRPEAALELLLTDDRDEAARLAQRLEELNRDRQAVEDRILRVGRRAGRGLAARPAGAARLRARGRELARRRDRDRRVAARRALPPPDRADRRQLCWLERRWRLEGIRPLDLELRPPRRARRLRRPPRAVRRSPRRRRPLDPARRASTRSRRRSPRTRTRR